MGSDGRAVSFVSSSFAGTLFAKRQCTSQTIGSSMSLLGDDDLRRLAGIAHLVECTLASSSRMFAFMVDLLSRLVSVRLNAWAEFPPRFPSLSTKKSHPPQFLHN